MRFRRMRAAFVAAACAGSLTIAASPGTGAAAPVPQGPGSSSTAIVSLGDSFISGEAGRWFGYSENNAGSRNGTDRAFVPPSSYDPELVYPGTVANGCHRSDVAPIRSNGISVTRKINLACSGASTINIARASHGGEAYKGEAPQADRLLPVARSNAVKMIVLSIGGNDLGFADIVADCTERFAASTFLAPDYCEDNNQPLIDQRMPAMKAGVAKAIDEVRAVMNQAGYTRAQYRFVLVSYPAPFPRGNEIRYTDVDKSRLNTGGCPLWNPDADWARDSVTPQIADGLKLVAGQKGVEFLDYRDAFEDHEDCSTHTIHVAASGPRGATAEWTRLINPGVVQGDLQESAHPNAYGQRALGRCLTLMYAKPAGGRYRCTSVTGQGPGSMALSPSS